jgi:glycosyltransferase involved in cell wall biosynthesis
MNIPFVIDAHTGVFDDPRWTWLLPLSRRLSRAATATIITNEYLQQIVTSWGARAVIFSAIPMTFQDTHFRVPRDHCNVVFINTFSRDEPLELVIKAAKTVPHIRVYVTGDLKRAPHDLLQTAPPNVCFTGWLSDDEYTGLLRGATVVMVLTTRDHTMQRGANEALDLEKPLITSNWPLLCQTFSRGTIHVDNTVAGITSGIETAIRDHELLATQMKTLRQERNTEFQTRLQNFLALLKNHSHFSLQAGEEKERAQV